MQFEMNIKKQQQKKNLLTRVNINYIHLIIFLNASTIIIQSKYLVFFHSLVVVVGLQSTKRKIKKIKGFFLQIIQFNMSKRETNRYEGAGEYDNLQQQEPMNFSERLGEEGDEESLVTKLRAFINSHRFHAVIVILVVVDCLCVALELFVFELERHMANDPSISDCINKITRVHNVSLHHIEPHHTDQHGNHLFFKIVEGVLKYTSLGILSLFVVEVFVKLIVEPKIFVKSKWEILDAVVVALTFMLNVFLLIKQDAFESVAGLFALLR